MVLLTVTKTATPVAQAAAVEALLAQVVRALAVREARALTVMQGMAVVAVAVKAVQGAGTQVVRAKPLLLPAQALPMRRAAAQTAAARVQPTQAMVVVVAQVVYLEAMVAQVLL
jgi:hypothetical protein